MSVSLSRIDPEADRDLLVRFMTTNVFPFHGGGRLTDEAVHQAINDGRFRSDEIDSYWVLDSEGRPAGFVRFEDLEDETPLFDLRLGEDRRGQGLGREALRAATDWVFSNQIEATRFEGNTRADNIAMRRTFESCGWVKEAHYRESWSTGDGQRVDGVAYAILRRDWETGLTTAVNWDDLPRR